MKELNPSNWIYWFGLITASCMLLPAVLVLLKKQFTPPFVALMVYFFCTAFYNFLIIVFPDFPKDIRRFLGVANNFLDAPLMLLFLSHFTHRAAIKKMIRISLLAFLVFELGIVLLYGFSVKSISIFSGPGLIIVLSFSFYFFTRHIRLAIIQKRDLAKTLMISGILFAYAVYFMVYLFYYVLETPNKMDALIIYLLASLVASVLLTFGLIRERNPISKEVIDERSKFKMPRAAI